MSEELNLQQIYKSCKDHTDEGFEKLIEKFPQFEAEINSLKIYIRNEVFKIYTGQRLLYILGDGSEEHNIKDLLDCLQGHGDSKIRMVSFELDEFGTGYALFESPEVNFEGSPKVMTWYSNKLKAEGLEHKYDYYESLLADLFGSQIFYEIDAKIIYIWYSTQFDLPDNGIWGNSIDSLKSILLDIKTKDELEDEIKRILKEE